MTNDRLAEILQRLRAELYAILGDDLHAVMLYGSQARGDARPDSDIDVLIVMAGPFDHPDLRKRTLEVAARLSLEYDTVISHAFVTREEYERGVTPFLLNVRREAVPI